MRILFVITKGSWGGATRYVHDLAVALHKKKISVAVAYGDEGILSEKLDVVGIPHYRVRGLTRDINPLREFSAYRELQNIVTDFNPDIVHVNSSKGGLAALAAKQLGKKVVFTVHGWAFNERRNFIAKSIFKAIYLMTILLSDKVILVSKALKKQIHRWPCQQKLEVIPNGIEKVKTYTKKIAREKLAEKSSHLKAHLKKTWILTIAELHDSKGLDVSIAALAELREEGASLPHYVVIGEGEERWRLEKLIDSYNLAGHVHLIGFVENAAQYIPSADLFILPSRTEALGYVLIEAGFAETPIIATRVGGIPEVIDSGENGILVPPNSGKVLATAMQKLLSNSNLREKYAERLEEKVREYFSLEKMLEDTERTYTRLLQS